MGTQCAPHSVRSTKHRRSPEGSIVIIPMEDGIGEISEEIPTTAKKPCFTETCLYHATKSLMVSFYVSGLLNAKHFDKSGFRKYLTATYIYSTVVLLMLTVNTSRYLSMFNKSYQSGSLFLFDVVYVVGSCEALGQFICFYFASCTYRRLPTFFHEWDRILKNSTKAHGLIIKLTNICTAVVWISVVSCMAFSTYTAIFTDLLSVFSTPLHNEHPYATLVVVFDLIMEFYLHFAWIAPSALMFLFCKLLTIEFDQVKQTITDLGRKGHIVLCGNLEGLRQHHEQLCALVDYADNLFSMQIGGSFAGSVFMTCVIAYILILGNSDTGFTLALIVHLVAAMMKVLIDCISGEMVNEAVSAHNNIPLHTNLHIYLFLI